MGMQSTMMRGLLPIAVWGYSVTVIALWVVMYFGGDRWWPATLLLFGPRWALLLPLILLVPWAGMRRRYMLIPLLVGGGIVAGPYMGLQFPLGNSGSSAGKVLRVVTCNVHNGVYNGSRLAEYISEVRADVVALQECSAQLGFPVPAGWHMVREGGLVVLSRFPLRRGEALHALRTNHKWPRASLLHCRIALPQGDVQFASVHLPSPRFGLQAVLDRRTILKPSRRDLLESETDHRRRVAQDVSTVLAGIPGPLVVAGDLNMPVDSTIYRSVWGKEYVNAFSWAGLGYGWTVQGGPRKLKIGVRVDHVLVRNGLGVLLCETGPDVGSDHRPLVADIAVRVSRKP